MNYGSFVLPVSEDEELDSSYVIGLLGSKFVGYHSNNSVYDQLRRLKIVLKRGASRRRSIKNLVEKSFSKVVMAAAKDTPWEFDAFQSEGFYAPRLREESLNYKLLSHLTNSGYSMLLSYPSELMLGERFIIAERLYSGNFVDFDMEKGFLTLEVGETYRRFRLEKLRGVTLFSRESSVEIAHLRLSFTRVSPRKARCRWVLVRGEHLRTVENALSQLHSE